MSRFTKIDNSFHSANSFDFLMRSREREKDVREKENKNENFPRTMKFSIHDQVKMSQSLCVRPFMPDKKDLNSQMPDSVSKLLYKTKKYLSVTDSLLYHPEVSGDKARKQSISVAKELIELISNLEEEKRLDETRNATAQCQSFVALGSNKSLSNSFHFPNNNASDSQYAKKIENLYQEKQQLQNLISQHERTNIKMYIQLNEGESEEIEKYKRLLASLFEKYKQLEKIVKRQAEKNKILTININEREKELKNLRPEIVKKSQDYDKVINQLQNVISEQNQALAMALNELEGFKQRQTTFKKREKQLQSMINEQKSKVISLLGNRESAYGQERRSQVPHPRLKQNQQSLYRMLFTQANAVSVLLRK